MAVVAVDPDMQVSGPPSKPFSEWPQELRLGVQRLRVACERDEDFRRHASFGVLEDADLVRFVLARNGDLDKAVVMLRRSLVWRTRRMPYWSLANPQTDLAQAFAKEMETGKITIRGRDRFGRGVLVLDNSVQNTTDGDAHMRLLAYAVEAARRACAPGVDKLCVAVNLEAFTLRNAVPRKVILESIEILTIVYPETLGNCILWQPPRYAMAMYNLFKPMLDARTLQKLNFVSGDPKPGGEVDRTLREVIGDDWRDITGLSAPSLERRHSQYFGREIACSNGFRFESFWSGQLQADRDHALRVGSPPWQNLDRNFVLDKANWDGAYPGFWEWGLPDRHSQPAGPDHVPDLGHASDYSSVPSRRAPSKLEAGTDDNAAVSDDQEDFATPPQSDGEAEGHSMVPGIIGRIYSPRIAKSLPAGLTRGDGPCQSLQPLTSCLVATFSSPLAVSLLSLLSLLLSAMLAAVSAAAILLEETDWDPEEDHQEGAFAAFWTMTLLDLPCAFAAVISLLCYSGPLVCPTKAQYFPRSLLLLRCFSLPEAFRSMVRAWSPKHHHQHHRRLSSMFPFLDSLLTVVLACLWAKRIADAENSYVEVPTTDLQLDT